VFDLIQRGTIRKWNPTVDDGGVLGIAEPVAAIALGLRGAEPRFLETQALLLGQTPQSLLPRPTVEGVGHDHHVSEPMFPKRLISQEVWALDVPLLPAPHVVSEAGTAGAATEGIDTDDPQQPINEAPASAPKYLLTLTRRALRCTGHWHMPRFEPGTRGIWHQFMALAWWRED
jgi:hypothetical protein